ncbi:acetyl-CoA C-acetyltransferase [Algiphilus aromaticivorans]|uniref:acetyl-CoA C-acetyltransferase n=1 Tax=Algiphilus aromaticivorans TaxID=382454 RepID=UPI0005C1EDC5|nr:acetyl-CoA C-acetyltransferase [Algiphilus aromaticivorans]
MPEAYIVDALRSPTGKRRGSLSEVHAADLGAHVLKAIVERNSVPAEEIDDVVFGCVDAVGPMAGNIARTCWLTADMPLSVPGVTIDRQCGSSQQAVHFAAQAVMSGVQDVVIAGGVQTMSSVPIGSSMMAGKPLGFDDPFSGSEGWRKRFGDQPVTQFHGAQMIADRWGLDRQAMERFALASHERALAALADGRFEREIVPLNGLDRDETMRQTSLEKMAELEVLAEGGSLTAAVASQTCDGASAVMVVSEAALKRYGLKPRARIHYMGLMGDDPIAMLTAPIPATQKALKQTGLRPADIDIAECNEAFASVPLAWMQETGFAHEQLNVNGGAIALGHPLGATGTKLMTTLLHELERRNGRYGLQTMCEGGGVANVTIIERLV